MNKTEGPGLNKGSKKRIKKLIERWIEDSPHHTPRPAEEGEIEETAPLNPEFALETEEEIESPPSSS